METNEQSSIFRYILIIVSFSIALVIYLKRKSQPTGESIQETIWRKIVFAYQDMLHTFDYAEKELLKHTYHNTIFNSKGINVSNGTILSQFHFETIVNAKTTRRKAPVYNSI